MKISTVPNQQTISLKCSSLSAFKGKLNVASSSFADRVELSPLSLKLEKAGKGAQDMALNKNPLTTALNDPQLSKMANQINEVASILDRMQSLAELGESESLESEERFQLQMEMVTLQGELEKMTASPNERVAIDEAVQEKCALIERVYNAWHDPKANAVYEQKIAARAEADFFDGNDDYFTACTNFKALVEDHASYLESVYQRAGVDPSAQSGVFSSDSPVLHRTVDPSSRRSSDESAEVADLLGGTLAPDSIYLFQNQTEEAYFSAISADLQYIEKHYEVLDDGRYYDKNDLDAAKHRAVAVQRKRDEEAMHNFGMNLMNADQAKETRQQIEGMGQGLGERVAKFTALCEISLEDENTMPDFKNFKSEALNEFSDFLEDIFSRATSAQNAFSILLVEGDLNGKTTTRSVTIEEYFGASPAERSIERFAADTEQYRRMREAISDELRVPTYEK